jgi:hypothetical protein
LECGGYENIGDVRGVSWVAIKVCLIILVLGKLRSYYLDGNETIKGGVGSW